MLYLARNPEQRHRLIEQPELMPLACEEFVRFFTPVHAPGRTATEDVDIDGWKVSQGERVMLAFSSANRDPEVFADPDDIKLDRMPNRHVGFGAGMHRCIGSHLARLMFTAMVSEVLERMPDYRIVEDQIEPYATVSGINGWVRILAMFTPGAKRENSDVIGE